MRVLVTGGAGYIGSCTAKILARAGYEPVVFDNLSTGHRWAVKWGPLVEGDLADGQLVSNTIREYGIGAVIHFAADALVSESMKKPREYFWHNAVSSLKLLDSMLDAGVKHLVFSSSAATYGIPQTSPIPEDHPQHPVNPYGEAKLSTERAMHWYGLAYGLHWMALRYFNAAGADPEGELGEEHEHETHLIPLVIQAAQGQRPCVEVYGTDYPTPDGTAIRDYIHIVDLAEAHVRGLEHILNGGESVALNLGTGQGHSVREVVAAVGRLCEGRVPARDAPRRPGDPPSLVADVQKAANIIGWRARLSDLNSIVETAWNWHAARAAMKR